MLSVESLRKNMFDFAKNGQENKANILRIVLSEIKNKEVEIGHTLNEEEIIEEIKRETKKIVDSIEQFEKMGRKDLLEVEKEQLDLLKKYLPEPMSEDAIKDLALEKIKEMGDDNIGKIIGAVMKEVKGRADGSMVKSIVESLLK
ncbi:MAG TPA: GatB/YqeY domain-containing protein [Candidatus Dojkabacteria bacterium]|nr:GatB/YqeY domain-containing protein [Candidatus Dojkabacteria bacterium]